MSNAQRFPSIDYGTPHPWDRLGEYHTQPHSHCHADDLLFHEKVKIAIDGKVLTSANIPRYDKSNKTHIESGIYENINYLDGNDYGIMIAITHLQG